MLKIDLEDVNEFLISPAAKFLFVAMLLIFLGSFFITMYNDGNESVCSEVKEVIVQNVQIEKKLMLEGHTKDAFMLYNSLEKLIKKADYCDTNLLHKLLQRRL